MKLALLVNRIESEDPKYTTTRLAMTASDRGHEVWYLGLDAFAYDPDDTIRARARRVPQDHEADLEAFLASVRDDEKNPPERIGVDDIDVLMLRNDPAEDMLDRPWAPPVGIIFGELLARRGVVVVNDPNGLSRALNKMYFHQFPAELRPKTLVTRDGQEARDFIASHDGGAVIKPLEGSGGHNVFFVGSTDSSNLNQIIEAVSRDGYMVVQEYLPAAEPGDVRLFMMNGKPLVCDGAYAAFRRSRTSEDLRSNTRVGAEAELVEVDDEMLRLAELARPKLIEDGMFLVGLDIAGDKLVEVNVFSAGGLGSAERVTGKDFTHSVVEALERKVTYLADYGRSFGNRQLATM